MRLLVTGASGLVGRELARQAASKHLTVLATTRSELDITSQEAANAVLTTFMPDLIINAAAYTAVDDAEINRDLAFAVNARGPENLARSAATRDVPIIHISTDYVFDGSKQEAYGEKDSPCPINVYGESKLAGEDAIQRHSSKYVIIRTAWVYGTVGTNFVKTMLKVGALRPALNVVGDQMGSPTFASDLAWAILNVAEKIHTQSDTSGLWGTFHCTNKGLTSWHGFAARIFALAAEHFEQVPTVHKITTAQYPTRARRPANSSLDCSKLTATYGIRLREWDDALAAMLETYFANGHGGSTI